MVRQFGKLDIQLDVRATDNNQYQDKVRRRSTSSSGAAGTPTTRTRRTFSSCSRAGAPRACRTARTPRTTRTPEYDKLFVQMKALDDGPKSRQVVDKLVKIAQQDAPWSFGFYPLCVSLRSRAGWAIPARHPDPATTGVICAWTRTRRDGSPDGTGRCGGPSSHLAALVVAGIWAARRTLRRARAHERARRSARLNRDDGPSSLRSRYLRVARGVRQPLASAGARSARKAGAHCTGRPSGRPTFPSAEFSTACSSCWA